MGERMVFVQSVRNGEGGSEDLKIEQAIGFWCLEVLKEGDRMCKSSVN